MKLILDTQVVLWWMDDDPRLSRQTRGLVAHDANEVFFSFASLWEVAIKHRIGKLHVGVEAVLDQLRIDRIAILPIAIEHVRQVEALTGSAHNDPFDHLIIAQAMVERARIVTSDAIMRQYDVDCIRA